MMDFEKITAEDSDRYLSYLRKCPEVPADCSNAVVFGYGDVWSYSARAYNKGLCWQKFINNGDEFWMPPLGDWQKADWKGIFSSQIAPGTKFCYIPETLMYIWNEMFPGMFDISYNETEWDYLYNIPELWSSNADLRTKYRRFCRNYSYETEIITSSNLNAVIEIDSKAGAEIRRKKSGILSELDDDDISMQRVLKNWNSLGTLSGILIKVNGEYVSYSIWDFLDGRAFELYNKNIYTYRDIHTVTLVERTAQLSKEGRLLLNDMCDAGDAGIRLSKIKQKPCGMLKKYSMVWHGF